ncbi:M16 family metallopeptidase [Polaribacter sargassicola]|uniref:M16 family metallopeptidase n=1 Tax=Polaribacter sargassicola TaxID=2836891 RepID=UPI001F3BB8F1|nr:M16 family metallopeptidase [Polaribacter sp. DS7-9]MCG1037305.1 insulinase family protein [Polaribacter sp. DS7-9]
MKKNTVLLAFLFTVNFFAQDIKLNNPLPENKKVIKGVLSNGFTYYIYKTGAVKNAASYYIIQNVGSILENEDQQGLAHFLEHMAFNGTKNFPDKGIINTLEKNGVAYGRDINAITNFEETVYNINNVPTTPELIDTSLLILHDWANFLSLKEEEIDLERGVVKEEWRTRQTSYMRVYEKKMPALFNNNIYTKRMPIGLMDVVDNFKYKTLRDFYYDWYRTDLQAIAVIGDINEDEVKTKIEKLFSSIPAVKNPRERFVVKIPENDKLTFVSVMDAEIKSSSIEFGIRHPKKTENRIIADLKSDLLTKLATMMLSGRLGELNDDKDSPLRRASVNYSSISRSTDVLTLSIFPKVNKQQEAFKMAFKELIRAIKFGFTEGELERTISKYAIQVNRANSSSHQSIKDLIQSNYLENTVIKDVNKEKAIAKQILNTITQEEVHLKLKELYTVKNRYTTATAVKSEKNITEKEVLQIVSDVENDATLIAYKDNFEGKTLLGTVKIDEGKIVSEKEDEVTNSTTYILSNGVKVHYKFADKSNVTLKAISYGGLSLIKDSDLASAAYINNVVSGSGLGDYSMNDLSKILAGKTARTNISISDITESVTGNSSTKDIETMLKMVHLRFVKPRFDKDVFAIFKARLNNQLIRRKNNLGQKIKDSINVAFYGDNNIKKPLFTKEYVESVSFETIKEIYKDRFKNASDFEFFFVGGVPKENIKPLLEKYIGSIPTITKPETYKDNSVEWVSRDINKNLFFKMENPKSTVRVTFENELKYTLKNELLMTILSDVLQLRYTETLREQEGGTYGSRTTAILSKRPVETANLTVSFDCNPEKADKLTSIVYDEIYKIADGNINQNDFLKSITNTLKKHKQQKNSNEYKMDVLTNFFIEGYDMNDPKNFENIVNNISIKDLKEITSKIIKGGKKAEIIVRPIS